MTTLRALIVPLVDALQERGVEWDADLLSNVVLYPDLIKKRIKALRTHEHATIMSAEFMRQHYPRATAFQLLNGSLKETFTWIVSNCCAHHGPEAGAHLPRCEVAQELRAWLGAKEIQRQADGARALAEFTVLDELETVAVRKRHRDYAEAQRKREQIQAADRAQIAADLGETPTVRQAAKTFNFSNVQVSFRGQVIEPLREGVELSLQEVRARELTPEAMDQAGYEICSRCLIFYPRTHEGRRMIHRCGRALRPMGLVDELNESTGLAVEDP